jgi:PAS domain S-box-containing protein
VDQRLVWPEGLELRTGRRGLRRRPRAPRGGDRRELVIGAPWTWAGIHGFFVLWASIGSVVAWRFNERAIAQTKLILESAGEGIFGLDLKGTVTFLNPAAATMLGVDPRVVVGEPLHRILRLTTGDGTAFSAEASPIEAALADGRRRAGTEDLFWPNSGTGFPVEYVVTPIIGGGHPTGVVVTFKDVTERKRAENNIRLLNQGLERRVLERTAALQELHADAERARREAEETARRARLLAEASRVLSSSLHYVTTLRDVVELMVPTLADWCVVQLVRRDGRLRGIGPAYAEPRLAAVAEAFAKLDRPSVCGRLRCSLRPFGSASRFFWLRFLRRSSHGPSAIRSIVAWSSAWGRSLSWSRRSWPADGSSAR